MLQGVCKLVGMVLLGVNMVLVGGCYGVASWLPWCFKVVAMVLLGVALLLLGVAIMLLGGCKVLLWYC